MSQNLLSVGLDVKALEEEVAKVLTIVENMYKELDAYEKMKISPISATGLTELTNSIKTQQTQVDKLTGTISELGLAMRAYNDLATSVAVTNAKLSASESDLAKTNMQAKVALEERNRILKQGARESNEDYQKRKAIRDKEIADAKFQADFEKELAAENKAIKEEEGRVNRETNELKKQNDIAYTKWWEEQLAQREAATKAATTAQNNLNTQAAARQTALLKQQQVQQNAAAAQKKKDDAEDARQKVAQGKRMLEQNDLYKQLIKRRNELNVMYANSIVNRSPAPVQQQLGNQLAEANSAIKKVDTALEKAGSGGASSFAKSLGSAFGIVRQLAYIIPGLGIAGIFNLAFEAIGKVVSEIGLFNDELDKTIEKEGILLEHMKLLNKAIVDRADAFAIEGEDAINYYKGVKDAAEASGENFVQQMKETDDLQKAQKQAAEDHLKYLGYTQEEYDTLNDKVKTLTHTQVAQLREVSNLDKQIKERETTPLEIPTTATEATIVAIAKKRSLEIDVLKETQEELLKRSGLENKITAEELDRFEVLRSGAKAVDDADQTIKNEALKRQKYFSDEHRKIVLSDAEKDVKTAITANEMILENDASTEKERLQALANIAEQENILAEAQYQNVLTNAAHTAAELNEADNKRAEAGAETERKRAEKSAKVIKDFFLKREEYIFLANQSEILAVQVTQKKVMENEEASYEERLAGFEKYTQARKDVAKLQFDKDVKVALAITPDDLKPQEYKKFLEQYKKNIVEIENDARGQAYTIAVSWFDKQLKEIKRYSDLEQSHTEDTATQELIDLNKSYNKKEISFKQYRERLEEIQRNSLINIDEARVADDKAELSRLKSAGAGVGTKLIGSAFSVLTGGGDKALGAMQGNKASMEKANKEIGDATKKLSHDELKAEEDKSAIQKKKDEEHADYIKQRNAAYAQLAEEGLNMIKELTDQAYEERIAQIESIAEAQNAAVDREIEAIERSTLSAKEKNAYEIQLQAQKKAREEEAARKTRKLKHEEAVFDKEVSIAKIIAATAVAVTNSLSIPGAGIGLAIAVAAMGAIELATALATRIPAYAEGGKHKGGLALFAEAGHELVTEPSGYSYVATRPTIKHLPAGTELTPLYDIPVITEKQDSSWAQTLYLGKQIAKSKREIKNVFKPKINIDLGKQVYANRILHG